MYEVNVTYCGKDESDTILCESRPVLESVAGGYLFLDCGKGQSLTLNVDNFVKITIKYPLPDRIPPLKYAIDIHYDTETEDVEMFFAANSVDVSIEGEDDGYEPVLVVKESDNIIRIINGSQLRSIKVSSYSEESK
jgi:hypothetical protein